MLSPTKVVGDEKLHETRIEREPKVVKFYKQLLIEGNSEPLQFNELFLLHPNTATLAKIIEELTIEQLNGNKSAIQALIAEILRVFEGEQGLKFFNACQTLSVLVHHMSEKFTNIVQAQCFLLPGSPSDFAKVFCQRFRDVIVGDCCLTLKLCVLNTLASLWIAFRKCQNNPLLFEIANADMFDAMISIFSYPDLKPLQTTALPLFAILMKCKEEKQSSVFSTRFFDVDNNIGVVGIGQFVTEQLVAHIDKVLKDSVGDQSNFLMYLTSTIFDLFGKDDVPSKFPKAPNLPLLLFLYQAIRLNRSVAIILTSPPQNQPLMSNHDGAYSNINASAFSNFLSFTSFIFADFNRENQRTYSKLCMLILWHIVDEPYVQSTMQDIHLANRVSLYKTEMLHRSAAFEPISSDPTTLSTALLELLTDFNATHLMLSFPFAHYTISLSIIHRMLIYHKKCRIRLQSWRPLFKSLVSIVNFLTQNHEKMSVEKTFSLLNHVLLVINFFITYGDTFLPDAAAYDFLYYEISRQSLVFLRLNLMTSEKVDDHNFFESKIIIGKVSNQLINILSIIEHVRPKLEIVAQSYPTQEQVISIVQSCFNDLTLKLYEGLEVVEFTEEKNMDEFLDPLVENMPLPVTSHWADKMDYSVIVDLLSNLELS